MASRHWIFLLKPAAVLTGVLLQACSSLPADNHVHGDTGPVIEPELERRSITEADIDSEDFEVGVFAGVMNVEDFGTNPVYGVRAAYHITEDFFTEGTLGRTDTDKTSYEKLSGGAEILSGSDRKLTYYNISLGYNLLQGEAFLGSGHAFNTATYVIAGIGNSEFADDSHFTLNFGVGYRFLLTDWIALRIDVRDHIFKSDLLGSDERKNNLEATGGVDIFF
jgi:outer membrane beta-barrel protein